MNHHARISPAPASVHPATAMYEIERAAHALDRASIVLRAVPNFPDCQELRASYRKHYDECVADMRKALENA